MDYLILFVCVILVAAIVSGLVFVLIRTLQSNQLKDQELNLTALLDDRLERNLDSTATKLGELRENLGKILEAQRSIHDLSASVNMLNNVMSNKQARGSFGEILLEDIVKDALPEQFFEFQASLPNAGGSSRVTVDCLLKIPGPSRSIAVDSKFPLESYVRLCDAESDDQRNRARRELIQDFKKHLNDIHNKYIIHGVTADCALMFLPSEAVFSTIHSDLHEIVAESQKLGVYVVSPSTMMATVTTLRSIYRDVEVRTKAEEIRNHLQTISGDVQRFSDRLANLQQHFDRTQKDVNEIQVSGNKIIRAIDKVNNLELSDNSSSDVRTRNIQGS